MDNVIALGARPRALQYHMLDAGGLRIRAAYRPGPPDRSALLFCNGIGARIEFAQPLFDALPGRTLIAFDAPGTGASPRPLFPINFYYISYICSLILDYFEEETVDLLGLSWGGGVAQEFARRYAWRCRRLVLAATSPGSLMVPGDPSALGAVLETGIYYRSGPSVSPARAGAAPMREPDRSVYGGIGPDGLGFLYQLAAGAMWTSLPWLWTLRQPTLILHGREDRVVPVVNAHLLGALIPDARVHLLPGGHLSLITHARAAAEPVDAFLK